MSFRKNADKAKKGPLDMDKNQDSDQQSFAASEDFAFVQTDKTIHDVRFKTKPTTYLGDAMKRFAKSRSAVVAACILGVLVLMAIVVPFADPNDIVNIQDYQKNLPPRWWGVNDAGFMDGTTSYEGVVGYDTTGEVSAGTDLDNVLPVSTGTDINTDCIVEGSLKSEWGVVNAASKYGYGGSLGLTAGNHTSDPEIFSPYANYDTSVAYTVSVAFDRESIAEVAAIKPEYSLIAYVDYDGDSTTDPTEVTVYVPAKEGDYSDVVIPDVSDIIAKNKPEGVTDTVFSASFGLRLKTNTEYDPESAGDYPSIYMYSYLVGRSDGTVDPTWDSIGFKEGNELYLRSTSEDVETKKLSWLIDNYGVRSVRGVHIINCSFRYDPYEAAFGDITKPDVPLDSTRKWIDAGLMSLHIDGYDLSDPNNFSNFDFKDFDPESDFEFEILDDSCPVRDVTKVDAKDVSYYDDNGKLRKTYAFSLTVVMSVYRYNNYSSMPMFVFGTDKNGWDYFKYLFTGLRTSLLLGVFAATINISFGLVWGSFSGYFGGWTDIFMERFIEILGGVPWIVVMTLCLLTLGQSFWTFLLALCLTGWIGVAEESREQFYRFKGREYVLASRTLGASDVRLIFKHILPNGIGTIVTGSVLMIPSVIFSEATIAYLGLGLKGMKSFGVALSDAQNFLRDQPYLIVSGAIIVSILMICFNLFGNGLRDAFNPSLKGTEQ
jgi:ABC-type dipeptide/oligopeptide/nickel transport system permease subunit